MISLTRKLEVDPRVRNGIRTASSVDTTTGIFANGFTNDFVGAVTRIVHLAISIFSSTFNYGIGTGGAISDGSTLALGFVGGGKGAGTVSPRRNHAGSASNEGGRERENESITHGVPLRKRFVEGQYSKAERSKNQAILTRREIA